ncbi:MAG: RluA family pseudouridine synthase, partial [Fimbriimonadales bacterium]
DATAVEFGKARPARTHFTVERAWRDFALLYARLETGRTHQVRVHCSAIGHPVVGDPLYGGARKPPRDCPPQLAHAIEGLQGQLLHACEIEFVHPCTGNRMRFTAPLPEDFQTVIQLLETAAPKAHPLG